tara:strand:- start:181 stop:684 length:504 start_codon:yes stop_codon:yes gene_type:complete
MRKTPIDNMFKALFTGISSVLSGVRRNPAVTDVSGVSHFAASRLTAPLLKTTLLIVSMLIASLLISGCSPGDQSDDSSAAGSDTSEVGSVAAGQQLFEQNCASCHPRKGRGNYLKRIPATLLTRRTEQDLMNWIRGSEKHREMPAFVDLSETERRDLSAYLLSQIRK